MCILPLMNCCGWHTLAFAFVIFLRVVKSTILVTIHSSSSLSRSLCFALFLTYTNTRSWACKKKAYTVQCTQNHHTGNVNANYDDIFAPFFHHYNRSLFLLQIFYILILNETQIGWLCLFWFDFSSFCSKKNFALLSLSVFFCWFSSGLLLSCVTTSVAAPHTNKLTSILDIKYPISTMFARFFSLLAFFLVRWKTFH